MAMDLHGILNQNEYYTNHYFTTIFEENASDTISAWRQSAKDTETQTPWAAFRDAGKLYLRNRERYLQQKDEMGSREFIESQAAAFISALGYGEPHNETIKLTDEITVPVYHEEQKANGAPLLWILLSKAQERDDDILQGIVFGRKSEEDEEFSITLPDNNDEILAKLFFAGAEAPRWIILIGMNQIALIDRNKWDKKKYLQFDLEEIFSRHEETTYQALAVLLHKDSLCPAEGNSLLDTLDENSYKHSSSVSDSLKYALRECIELLGNEVLYDMRTRQGIDFSEHPVDAGDLTLECLRYMYRILFILFIEAREELGFAPMKSDVYQKGYSLEGVRDVCENVRELSAEAEDGYYIGETIAALFNMIYMGYPEDPEAYKVALKIESPHDMFTMEPLKAHIFDPQYTEIINNAKLRNVTMLKIVDLMSISRPGSSKERRGRISYSALGINQMGAVYEALLSYRGFIAEEDLYEVKRAGDKFNELDVGYFVSERELDKYTEEERVRYEDYERKGKLRMYEKGTFIYRLAGREREKSASYYTPEVLTKCLVKYALKELLKDKSADEILNLTVCEPAMGSAAFLNEAISQLAEAYLEKKQEETGEQIAFDKRQAELQRVKMFIADRNVYGVDLNPIAVELAEVSLWLNTIYKGAHVPWFGTQLACGNSLIGARRQVYNALKLKKGTWYNDEPEKVPEEWITERHETRKVYKRKRSGGSYIYHFLLGDPGMANYTDKVIKELEPENIKRIKAWQKEFCAKYTDDDIEVLNKLSEIIDDLWMRTIYARQKVEQRTEDSLSVFGHDEGKYEEHLTIREKDAIYKNIYKSEGGDNASPYARLKAAMDYWCALWFWPIDQAHLLPSRQEFFMELSLILEGGISATVKKGTTVGQLQFFYDEHGQFEGFGTTGSALANEVQAQISGLGKVNLEQIRELYPRLRIANEIAEKQHFMHWELEFADLFYERGGFDLVIGNPPWIKPVWNEYDMLSESEPRLVIKKMKSAETAIRRKELFSSLQIESDYCREYINIAGIQSFIGSSGNYDDLKGGSSNLYKCFVPLSVRVSNEDGVFAFVHPDGIIDDPQGKKLRKLAYRKLRRHFQFVNERNLFADVAHTFVFGINVYSNKESDGFDTISNLFAASTIEDCYNLELKNSPLPAIKDENNNWNIVGHPDRLIHITKNVLTLLADIFGDSEVDYSCVCIPSIHVRQFLDVLQCFASQKKHMLDLKNDERISIQYLWHDTYAQEDGTIKEDTKFPDSWEEMVYTGPLVGVGNPIYKTPRTICIGKADYDRVDLVEINSQYIPRSKYTVGCALSEYIKRAPVTPWGTSYLSEFKLLSRKMLNVQQERTLMGCIVPRGSAHTNGLTGIVFSDLRELVIMAAGFASLPFDFFVKALKKSNLYEDVVGKFPVLEKYTSDLVIRALLLNGLGEQYRELWEKVVTLKDIDSYTGWLSGDERLSHEKVTEFTSVRNDFQRRQLQIEIDVIVAKALGMTLDQLKDIYHIQFSVLQIYEGDTWYDRNGRIVFTNNRSLTNVGFSRKEWDEIKDAKSGIFTQTIIDDTMPGGPIERTIEYVAPFDRCDREKDYEEVWANFEERIMK